MMVFAKSSRGCWWSPAWWVTSTSASWRHSNGSVPMAFLRRTARGCWGRRQNWGVLALIFHDFPWFSHDFPWFSHDFPWFSMIFHDFPMFFPCFSWLFLRPLFFKVNIWEPGIVVGEHRPYFFVSRKSAHPILNGLRKAWHPSIGCPPIQIGEFNRPCHNVRNSYLDYGLFTGDQDQMI